MRSTFDTACLMVPKCGNTYGCLLPCSMAPAIHASERKVAKVIIRLKERDERIKRSGIRGKGSIAWVEWSEAGMPSTKRKLQNDRGGAVVIGFYQEHTGQYSSMAVIQPQCSMLHRPYLDQLSHGTAGHA